jgi:PAS domain S-box-containing protein
MAKEGSIGLSTDCRIIRFGRGIEEILGYTEEEVRGREFGSMMPPETAQECKRLIEQVMNTPGITGHKVRLLCKDGQPVDLYVSVFPLRDRSGKVHSLMLSLSVDETDEVPAILSNEFQRIFRFSNDAVVVTDRDANIIDVNRAFLDTYGYEREEVLGRNPRILKSEHSTKEQSERMWRDILDPEKGFWKGEIVNIAKDGREVPVLLSINAIRNDRGDIKKFLGIAFDMTRQKELDTIKRMYIDYIIHDMKGPLTSIMANSEILMMLLEDRLDAPVKKKLDQIFNCSEKIAAMTNDILDYSRAKNGVLPLRKARVGFKKILKHAVQPFESLSKKLVMNGAPYDEALVRDVELEVDSDKLQRIIYNLLNNAFKYAEKEVRIDWEIVDQGLKLKVSNDGEGIKKETAERVFEAFFQTEEGVKTGGAGLGLSIVKTFVEAHGGSVWMEPGEAIGTTVGFKMPV